MAGLISPAPHPTIPPTNVPPTTTPGATGNTASMGGFNSSGVFTAGVQPPGNNYPSNIYGVGPGGSGTAVGTLQNNELTSYNLNQLTDSNNPYIKQATQGAINQANSRGLLNSSIAAGNARGAAIQAALPIAQSDAQAALGLQSTNLNNLSKAETANIGANAEMTSAGTAASASMDVARQNNAGALLRQQDDLAFQGEQAGLNYQRDLGRDQQQYYNAAALSQQGYQQNLGLDSFNLGATLLQGQQSFFSSAGLAAMNDPAIMGNPEAFGGYLQFLMNPFSSIIDNVFSNPRLGLGNYGTPQPAGGGG